jgi:hypothetical protein
MEEYNIIIFRQSRILLCLFLLPIIFLSSIIIGAETHSFIFSILFLAIGIMLIYYFVIGNLKVIIKNNDKLFFEWKKKFIFNFKPIAPIRINEIKTIVLDEGMLLRKIKTDKDIIYINNAKIIVKDAELFVSRLKNEAEKYNIEIIDSWDEIAKKGYLKIAYTVSSCLLIISILSVIVLTLLKGFNPFSLSVLFLFIPQIILYKKQMRNRIK